MFVRTLARRALAVKTGTQNQYGHKIGIKFPNFGNPRRSDQHQRGDGSLSRTPPADLHACVIGLLRCVGQPKYQVM